ncbi:MAG: head-tail connector protein [Burkholderiaceae bacterium]
MVTLVNYTGDEPVALAEVKAQCRIDHDAEDAFITEVIIPGARALAESKTGSAIRKGTFTDVITLGGTLSVGQVISVDTVKVDGVSVAFTATEKGRRTAVESVGNEGKTAVVGFTAGTDIAQFPGVKSWLLLACGWMYAHRESLTAGPNAFNEMPAGYVDALLSAIDVPDPF